MFAWLGRDNSNVFRGLIDDDKDHVFIVGFGEGADEIDGDVHERDITWINGVKRSFLLVTMWLVHLALGAC
jgi:hypothetical protein